VVDPATLARGDGMQALHAAARFIDRLPATDRLSVAVLPQWETALRFDESREASKDRLLRGCGTGIANTPLDGRRRQEVGASAGWMAMSADQRESSLPPFTRASTTERLISTLTGGLAMSPTSGDTFFERFEREQAGGYVLAFEPTSADRDGHAHEIRVTIGNHPGTTIRTRHEFAVPAPSPRAE